MPVVFGAKQVLGKGLATLLSTQSPAPAAFFPPLAPTDWTATIQRIDAAGQHTLGQSKKNARQRALAGVLLGNLARIVRWASRQPQSVLAAHLSLIPADLPTLAQQVCTGKAPISTLEKSLITFRTRVSASFGVRKATWANLLADIDKKRP